MAQPRQPQTPIPGQRHKPQAFDFTDWAAI